MICHLHYAEQPCEQCAVAAVLARAGIATPRGFHSVIVFKEGVFEHIYDPWETPVPIDNPETLRAECEKRGVTSHYLRDSLLWRSGARRWV